MCSMDEITRLKEKQRTYQKAIDKAEAQLEVAVEERKKLVSQLYDKFGITPEEIDAKIIELTAERDKQIAEIARLLDGIEM